MGGLKQLIKNSLDISASLLGSHNHPIREPRLWILMYHRILPRQDHRFELEEPGMIVTPESLEMHILEAKKIFTIISLSEWIERYEQNQPLPRKACVFTFDDGWRDNLEYAQPLLKKHQIPATLFAVTDKAGSSFRFWPNIVSELIFAKSPRLADHPILAEAANAAQQPFSKEAIAKVIRNLKQHSDESIFEALEDIDWQKGLSNVSPALMNWQELMDSHFEIGSHTSTHRRLTHWLDAEAMNHEIVTSKISLTERIGHEADLFCYPNGDYSQEALTLVQQHYKAAVTTQKGVNYSHQLNPHELKRIPLHNDISDTPIRFRARLAAW
jgi:peptidoglycan/xylan/chitin deacetylase (PgdA/CDA1 family)